MSRSIKQQERLPPQLQNALTKYVAVLEKTYPQSKGRTRILLRKDGRVIVSVRLPTRAPQRMRLFDRMAEVGTQLLLDTNQYIILSGQ